MTSRDRIVVVVVAFAALVAAFWLLALAPKRKESHALDTRIASVEQRLRAADASAVEAARAKRSYYADYAAVAALGKAVPTDDSLPSLIYQLNTVSHGDRIDLRSLKVTPSTTADASTPSAAVGQAADNASSGTAPAAGSPSPTGATSGAATATLPPGASPGTAGYPTLPFSFDFNGSYFGLQQMLASIGRFVVVRGDKVHVRGRLLSIDGISMQASPTGFPQVSASVSATAYLLPDGQSATGGAAPAGPTAGTQASVTGSAP